MSAWDRPPRWADALVLAAPLLVVVALLHGLTDTLITFHGDDEAIYHVPTIAKFVRELPGIDLRAYPAAQTPLFHVLFALVVKAFEPSLAVLRGLNVLISLGLAVVAQHVLVARLGLRRGAGLALALALVCSPYVFGASFLLLTDNLGLLFALLAVERLLVLRERRELAPFAAACGWICLALLTRQSYAWLVPITVVALVLGLPGGRRRVAGAGLVVLAAAPLGALVVLWGGLIPRSADPASCGLCAQRSGGASAAAMIGLRPVAFTLAVVGVYALALFGPRLLRDRLARPRAGGERRAAAVGAGVGVALVAVAPMRLDAGPAIDAGWLWQASTSLPVLLGSSLLFWLLVPLGTATLGWRWARGTPRSGWMAPLFLLAFLASTVAIRLVWQKYFDPFALLALLLTLRPEDLARRWDLLGIGVVLVGSAAYAVSFVT